MPPLILSNTKLHSRTATKKSGQTIETFLKKMQQQMGVVMIGFAAYRNEEGKLCTFEYVTFLPTVAYPQLTSIQFFHPRK